MTTTKPLPADITPHASNIIAIFRSADAGQIADGLSWYSEAHSLALSLDPADPLRAAGVISALSPMTPWGRNKDLAVRAYADGVSTGNTSVACGKANRILAGEDVASVLNAPKTVNFALTIANPADPHAVVVDRHAFDIAVGRTTDDKTRGVLGRKGVYDLFADAYREAARVLGYSPSQVQAVTWVVWRESAIRTAAAMRKEAGR